MRAILYQQLINTLKGLIGVIIPSMSRVVLSLLVLYADLKEGNQKLRKSKNKIQKKILELY